MNVIEQIKARVSIAAVVAPYTNGLKRPQQTNYGHYLNGWCPWCQNGVRQKGKPRKFWVNIETGLCNCFNPSCRNDKPMDVINFYARIEGVSNGEAIKQLKGRVGG